MAPSQQQQLALALPGFPGDMPNPFAAFADAQAGLQRGLQRALTGGAKRAPKRVHMCPAFASLSMPQLAFDIAAAAPAKAPAKGAPAKGAAAKGGAPAAKRTVAKKSLGEILEHAGKRALSGGIPGMAAMAVQVFALMWMRTTINYQYRYGTTMAQAFATLYKEAASRASTRAWSPRWSRARCPASATPPPTRARWRCWTPTTRRSTSRWASRRCSRRSPPAPSASA